jgi:hypothetical protein
MSMLTLAKPKTTKDLKVLTLLPTDADAARIVGPEFMLLVIPCGQAPCTTSMRHVTDQHADTPTRYDKDRHHN